MVIPSDPLEVNGCVLEDHNLSEGAYVEKYKGDARYEGIILKCYHTLRGKARYVVEVIPQGFQMITSDDYIRELKDARQDQG